MKLIFTIVHDDDAISVMDELNARGFVVTKLSSTGGFLKAGNSTLLLGVEEDVLDSAIEIIKKMTKSRKQRVQNPYPIGAMGGMFKPESGEVVVSGATVLVTNIERFEKV